ncbi:hypothetical protein EVAR_25871_1 [Eumeta japonica]|uniref:Uncharacterized protein n=1 Tax=Eumeta variegata TaxID=151549 RepID=A0A4C1X4Z1_EUMVA|nr:hypothetical protein EVAR_25871_1 [Eumeta japonica]
MKRMGGVQKDRVCVAKNSCQFYHCFGWWPIDGGYLLCSTLTVQQCKTGACNTVEHYQLLSTTLVDKFKSVKKRDGQSESIKGSLIRVDAPTFVISLVMRSRIRYEPFKSLQRALRGPPGRGPTKERR